MDAYAATIARRNIRDARPAAEPITPAIRFAARDFGYSLRLDDRAALTLAGQVEGFPRSYAPAEVRQAEAVLRAAAAAMDQWTTTPELARRAVVLARQFRDDHNAREDERRRQWVARNM